MTRAIGFADIIGIPEPAHLILDMLPIPTPPDLSSLSMQWRGVLSVFHYLINSFGQEEAIRLHSRLLTASFINYDLELWGGYDLIMQAAGSCSVICSHPDIAAALRDRFHVEVHQVILIPPERKFAHRASDTSGKSHFPDFFSHLLTNIIKQFIFQFNNFPFGIYDLFFVFFQLRGYKPFRIYQGLFPDIIIRHFG